MATRTYVELTDDLTGEGGEDVETYEFGVGRTNYEIDLNEKNGQELMEFLDRYVEVARKVKVEPKTRKVSSGSGSARMDPEQSKAIRERWNEAHPDNPVSARGRIPQHVIDWHNAA